MVDYMVDIMREYNLKKLLKKDRKIALEIYFEKCLVVNHIIQK